MSEQKKTGRRVQIYIPADLVAKWDALPRYERSAEVARALRQLWSSEEPKTSHLRKVSSQSYISVEPMIDEDTTGNT